MEQYYKPRATLRDPTRRPLLLRVGPTGYHFHIEISTSWESEYRWVDNVTVVIFLISPS